MSHGCVVDSAVIVTTVPKTKIVLARHLPKGFVRIRNFGFLANCRRITLLNGLPKHLLHKIGT